MRTFLVAPLLVAVAVAIAALDRETGVRGWWQLRGELAESRARIGRLQAENAALEREVRELEGDAFALERAIREDLELARPGETVLRLGRRDASIDGSSGRFP